MDADPVPKSSAGEVILQAMTGFTVAQVLYVTASLGVADHLLAGPRTARELSAAVGADEASFVRLCRALEAAGILVTQPGAADQDALLGLTDLGRCLARDVEGSVHSSVVLAGGEHYRVWGELLHTIRTGEAAYPVVFGSSCYDHLSDERASGDHFDRSMTETAGDQWAALAEVCDLTGVSTVVDVGGGHGDLLATILRANPDTTGILYDLPAVVAGADQLDTPDLAGRVTTIGGSFFDGVPAGADAYLMARTLLNFPHDDVRRALRSCRAAMEPGARLFVIEPLVAPGPPTMADAFNDLNLFVLGGGGMATEADLVELLVAERFRHERTVATATRLFVIEASPV
jgi:hypothetical protein